MAQFIIDIRTDLDKSLTQYTFGGKMFSQDNKANRINVYLYQNNIPVSATGDVVGIVKRNDGKAVAFPGGIDNGKPYIELPETAYAVEGPISILIRLTEGETKTVIAICDAYVTKTADADYVTAGSTVVSIQELVDALDELDPLIARLNSVNLNSLNEITNKLEDISEAEADLNELITNTSAWYDNKVNTPTTDPNGVSGQVLRTNGDGTTTWVEVGLPTDSQTAQAVSDWLDAHPEATTTVQDGAITRAKLDADLQEKTDAVDDLKSNFQALYANATNFPDNATVSIGYTINNSGEVIRNSKRALIVRWKYRDSAIKALGIVSDVYDFLVGVYTSTQDSSFVRKLTDSFTHEIQFLPDDANYFSVAVARKDNKNIASSEADAILSSVLRYGYIDTTLTKSGFAADAKTTGDALYKPMRVKMAMEHGTLRDIGEYAGFLQDRENIYSSFYTSMRTPHMLDVSMAKTLAFSTDYDTIDVFAYDDQYAFVSITSIASDSTFSVPSGVHYVRFVAKKTNNATINEIESSITVISTGSVRVIYSPDHRATNTTSMCFVVKGKSTTGSMKDSTALLRLPPNYSADGEPVPLLVHMHGTTGYKSKWQISLVVWNDEENTNPLRTDIVSYIVNEGFAVLDVFGHIENYVDDYAYPYGSPDQMLCIASAIERVMNVYNVRKDGIYISGISAGGVPSITQVFHNNIPVKCCALLAPTVSLFRNCFGANASGRKEWAAAAGFVGDDSVLNGYMGKDKYMYHPTINNALKEYFAANVDKIISYNPMWSGLVGVPQSTLTQWALSDSTEAPGSKLGGGDDVAENWADKYRVCHKPIKLWVADDDTNISPPICHNFITTLRNTNCPAVERIMPNGEGGHYAFTTSETVETLSGQTALGIDYVGIPYPWIEMIQFFRMY